MSSSTRSTSVAAPTPLLVLLFTSGAAALIAQVLWLRQLSLVFGATAYAAAAVLAVFFLGQALGSFLWGERAKRVVHPLRLYAQLELGIAATAASFYLIVPAQRWLAPWWTTPDGEVGVISRGLQLALTAALLLPTTTLQGGTLPVLGRSLITRSAELGSRGSGLYSINTLGAAAGALAAGFFLTAHLGVARAYAVAIGLNLVAGLVALWMSRRESPHAVTAAAVEAARPDGRLPREVWGLALLSGFVAIGLEVLWTRMFAQVLHNSTYSFSAILVTFLAALGCGAALARRLCRVDAAPAVVTARLLTVAGAAVAASPWLFHAWTDGLQYVAPQAGWQAYVVAVFTCAAVVLLVPGTLVGALYPFTLHWAAQHRVEVAPTLGRLAAVNTLGAVAGSLVAGFVLLPGLGLWSSIRALALLYLAAAVLLAARAAKPALAWVGLPLLLSWLFATWLDPARLPLVRLDEERGEVLYGAWESAYGVTAVVRSDKSLRVKMDNYYSLGGTGSSTYQRSQADIPLILQPRLDAVFVLGMGSGITAGAVLHHEVKQVVVAELVPEVVRATERFFAPYSNGLFEDPRVRMVVGDGRSLLRSSSRRYDVVLGDLFIPWQAGAGSLYTKEHFEAVRDHLTPDGAFAQWLPLYQLTREQTMSIARTMLEVFPQVTLWRGDFMPNKPIVALIGQPREMPLDPEVVLRNFRHRRQQASAPREAVLALTGLFYGGNLSQARDLFATAPIQTDDRPQLELEAPVTHREQAARSTDWFTGMPLIEWYGELARRVPPESDPYLVRLTPEERGGVVGGRSLLRSKALLAAGDRAGAEAASQEFSRLVPRSAHGLLGMSDAAPEPASKNRIPSPADLR